MKIKVNDIAHEIAEGTSLAAFVESIGLAPEGVAVAIDLEVVPKGQWASTTLVDGMELIVIRAASGG
jgi:sulfur carrier protein